MLLRSEPETNGALTRKFLPKAKDKKREKKVLGAERYNKLRRSFAKNRSGFECQRGPYFSLRFFFANARVALSLRDVQALFARRDYAQFNCDWRRLVVIVRIIGNADKVGGSCNQEHHPQHRTAK